MTLKERLKTSVLSIQIPTWASIALAVAATVLAVLNQTTFDFVEPWSTLVTAGLAGLAALGIAPLTSGKLRTLLHLTYPAALAIASVLTTLATGLTAISGLNTTLRGILVGVVTAVAALLGGPADPSPVPAPPAPAPAPSSPVASRPVSKGQRRK